MILIVEDGLLTYYDKNGKNLPYSRLGGADLKHRFSFQSSSNKYVHLKLFSAYLFMLTACKMLFQNLPIIWARLLEATNEIKLNASSELASVSIEVPRRARRAKSDRLDVGKLMALLRHRGGERGVWSVVRVPNENARGHPPSDARDGAPEGRSQTAASQAFQRVSQALEGRPLHRLTPPPAYAPPRL